MMMQESMVRQEKSKEEEKKIQATEETLSMVVNFLQSHINQLD
jgi:hypothetical protein